MVVGALSSPMEAVAVDTIAEQLDCLVLADVFSGSEEDRAQSDCSRWCGINANLKNQYPLAPACC